MIIIENINAKTELDIGTLEREIDEVLQNMLEDTESPMYRNSDYEIFIDAMDMTCGDVRNVASFDLNDYIIITTWCE